MAMTKGTLASKKVPDINAQLTDPSEYDIIIKGNSSVVIDSLGESCDANKSAIQLGSLSNFMGHHSKKDENIIFTKMKKPVENMPKPRTALIQGGEDDEPMAPQIAIACQHERKYIVSNNLDALNGKEMKMSPRKFVYIGTMQGTKRQQEVKEKEKENFGCSKQLSHDVDL